MDQKCDQDIRDKECIQNYDGEVSWKLGCEDQRLMHLTQECV